MFTRRVICTRCGRRYLGTAATGDKYKYRYYTCYSRNRYGTHGRDAERLPAEQLDQAVINALLATYQNVGLFEQAVAAVAERQQMHEKELTTVDGEITAAEAGSERYLRAFESRTLPEDTCGHRVRELAGTVTQLRERKTELLDAVAEAPQAPSQSDLARILTRVEDAVRHGTPAARKALLQALVHEVRVTGRPHVRPVFRLPSAYIEAYA